jgi:hypothetical protein
LHGGCDLRDAFVPEFKNVETFNDVLTVKSGAAATIRMHSSSASGELPASFEYERRAPGSKLNLMRFMLAAARSCQVPGSPFQVSASPVGAAGRNMIPVKTFVIDAIG